MKTAQLLSAIFCFALLSACHHDDDPIYTLPTTNKAFEGEWFLVQVNGSIAGTQDSFPEGEIIWNFNTANHTVTITNNNTDPDAVDLFDSGTYTYSIQANTVTPEICSESIFVDNTGLGCFTFDQDNLTLSQVENDGYELHFVKTFPFILQKH